MALYRVLFSGVAGGFVAYAAIATIAGAAAFISPAEHGSGDYQIVHAEPASPDPDIHPSHAFSPALAPADEDRRRYASVG